ncbi:MAG: hypothetical protein NUV31_06660 [Dehalococcoidales bacterium]|jgi:hypothetical protein|nr:hypothetical protein [Dehalococcoidales bacterium]
MSERKYSRYIIKDVDKKYLATLRTPERILEQKKAGNYFEDVYMFHLDDTILEGGFYTDCHWITGVKGNGGVLAEIAHTHDFGETIGFVGSIRENPRALGGLIEIWLEDEQYFLEESCLIFIPAGMKHMPLRFLRVDSPIFFWTASDVKRYGRTSGKEF